MYSGAVKIVWVKRLSRGAITSLFVPAPPQLLRFLGWLKV